MNNSKLFPAHILFCWCCQVVAAANNMAGSAHATTSIPSTYRIGSAGVMQVAHLQGSQDPLGGGVGEGNPCL